MTQLAEQRKDIVPFIALEAATVISGTGNGVAAIALPWLVLQLTNDPAAAGLVVAIAALPQLAASLVSGVIIDRLGRQRTSVGSDIFSAVSAAMIPVFGLLGMLTYPLLLLASVVGAVFDPVGVTAREALLPDVAKRAKLALERVNGVHEAVWGLAWLIGPGVAGLLIASVGAEASFWAMFAGFALSAMLVGFVCMPTPPAKASDQHWLSDALDGARLAWNDPAIRSTSILTVVGFSAVYSVVGVVLPVVFEALDKPRELGLLFMGYTAAGIVGALLYSARGERVARRTLFVTGLAASALVPAVFALSNSYWVQFAVLAVSGFLAGAVNPVNNIVIQERAPEAMRGRVLSVVFAFDYAVFPVGYVAAGYSVKAFGAQSTFAAITVVALAVALWAALTPALRDLSPPPVAS